MKRSTVNAPIAFRYENGLEERLLKCVAEKILKYSPHSDLFVTIKMTVSSVFFCILDFNTDA
jgi:hypothetical protein